MGDTNGLINMNDTAGYIERILSLTWHVIQSYGMTITGDVNCDQKDLKGSYYDNSEMTEFKSLMLACPIPMFKSLPDVFQVKKMEDAVEKSIRMSDSQIIDLIEKYIAHKVKEALDDDKWERKFLTKIITSDDSLEEKVVRIETNMAIKHYLAEFVKLNKLDYVEYPDEF